MAFFVPPKNYSPAAEPCCEYFMATAVTISVAEGAAVSEWLSQL